MNFTGVVLPEVLLNHYNLNLAILKNTNIEKVDSRTSYNFFIAPEMNNIQNAKFLIQKIPGLLEKYNIE